MRAPHGNASKNGVNAASTDRLADAHAEPLVGESRSKVGSGRIAAPPGHFRHDGTHAAAQVFTASNDS